MPCPGTQDNVPDRAEPTLLNPKLRWQTVRLLLLLLAKKLMGVLLVQQRQSLSFFSRVSVVYAFNIFLYRSCIRDKSFLAHFFQRNSSLKTVRRANLFKFANGLKSDALPVGHERQSPRYGSHVKKHDTRLLIGRIVFSTGEKK